MLLLSIGSLRFYELDRVFDIAADLGFDGVEVIVDDRWDTTDPLYLRRLAERYRMPIPSLHSPFSFVDTVWGNDPVVRMENSIRLAAEIGAELVVLHLPFFAERRYIRWVDEEIPRIQERTAVKLAVENMPHACKILGPLGVPMHTGIIYDVDRRGWRNRLLRPLSKSCFVGNTWEYLRRFRYLVLDTTHLATGGGNPIEEFERMKQKLALIHVSNFNGKEHQPLAEGRIDFAQFLRHVARSGYAGHITLELMPDHFPDRGEATARRILAADLALCRECLSGST
ncbi:MAG: sugar phosphate isomerase/epimerase [Candidatus Aureabacteria bacterium]|nr:sugar phosphate isomerase/epimerase [Candidatus Auribacterota bacterium]